MVIYWTMYWDKRAGGLGWVGMGGLIFYCGFIPTGYISNVVAIKRRPLLNDIGNLSRFFFDFELLKVHYSCHILINRHLRSVYVSWIAWLKSLLSTQCRCAVPRKLEGHMGLEWLPTSRLLAGLGTKEWSKQYEFNIYSKIKFREMYLI